MAPFRYNCPHPGHPLSCNCVLGNYSASPIMVGNDNDPAWNIVSLTAPPNSPHFIEAPSSPPRPRLLPLRCISPLALDSDNFLIETYSGASSSQPTNTFSTPSMVFSSDPVSASQEHSGAVTSVGVMMEDQNGMGLDGSGDVEKQKELERGSRKRTLDESRLVDDDEGDESQSGNKIPKLAVGGDDMMEVDDDDNAPESKLVAEMIGGHEHEHDRHGKAEGVN